MLFRSINYSDSDEVFLGRDFTSKQNYSEELASKIDQEVRRIIDKAYADAEQILKDHRDELDRVAGALLEMETLDQDEFEAIYSNTRTVEELKAENSKRSEARKVVEEAEAKARAEKEAEELLKAKDEGLNPTKRVAVMDEKGNVRNIVTQDLRDDIRHIFEKDPDPQEEEPAEQPEETEQPEKDEEK